MFEYWCFIKTVYLLRERFGPPEPDPSIKLIHGIYRPDLAPGQKFIFQINNNVSITVYYEPDILPWDASSENKETYAASLTKNPLRPDILIVLHKSGRLPVLMVLDAKSTDKFDVSRL